MNDDAAKALERVRKMLNLARDEAASEGERDNAMRMAHATLAKYNLSMADAELAGKQQAEKRGTGDQETLAWPWMRHVQYGIGRLFFCVYYYARSSKRNHTIGTFVGRESNVETARNISEYVIQSIVKEANAHKKKGGDWLSFCKGASMRVLERCEILRREAESASAQDAKKTPGTAVVLASFYEQEERANNQFLAEINTKLVTRQQRKSKRAYSSDYNAGREHGDKINLSRQISGSKPQDKDLLPY